MEERDAGVDEEGVAKKSKANDPIGRLVEEETGEDGEELRAFVEENFEEDGDEPEKKSG